MTSCKCGKKAGSHARMAAVSATLTPERCSAAGGLDLDPIVHQACPPFCPTYDELPCWTVAAGKPHLVVPYTLSTNDAKFGRGTFATDDDFFIYCRDAFDFLYRKGRVQPCMRSIGLHQRLIGHPARAAGLEAAARPHPPVRWCPGDAAAGRRAAFGSHAFGAGCGSRRQLISARSCGNAAYSRDECSGRHLATVPAPGSPTAIHSPGCTGRVPGQCSAMPMGPSASAVRHAGVGAAWTAPSARLGNPPGRGGRAGR